MARLYFKADVEFFAGSGRREVLSKLIPKGYKPKPAAIREVVCEMYRAGVDIWGSPSKCWVKLQLETLLENERSDILGERSYLNADQVILLDGVKCFGQFVMESCPPHRLFKVTTDRNHVHHLAYFSSPGKRSRRATELHGAVAGRQPW